MADDTTYETYRPELLPAIVSFWNRVFADRRNFYPVTERSFRDRVTEKSTAVESFSAPGFFVARRGERVIGLLHAGRHPESVCRVLQPDWPGGEQGYIALIAVDPEFRRQGVGTLLWHRACTFLDGTVRIVIDGQCLNPFYGNSQGPATPFWGTPEGISIDSRDSQTQKFFAKRGYAPRFKAVQLQLDVANAPRQDVESLEADLRSRGFLFQSLPGIYPELGGSLADRRQVVDGLLFEVLVAMEGDRVAALLCTYPMIELAPDRHAIYEMAVHPDYQGRGIGRILLALAVERLRIQAATTCDVLTIPEISGAAFDLYRSTGFQPCAEWAVY